MRSNLNRPSTAVSLPPQTHEGGPAAPRLPAFQQLERQVGACLLFERTFYEGGDDQAQRIYNLVGQVPSLDAVGALAVKARHEWHLRHAPLWLMVCALRHNSLRLRGKEKGPVSYSLWSYLRDTIGRADEIAEFVAQYWRDGKRPLAKQAKEGLRLAFAKFDAYQFSKWDRKDREVRIRDVMFLVRPHPGRMERAPLYQQIADDALPPADTWEVALSGGADKKAAFERLLAQGRLGYSALLQNLRNMEQAGVDRHLVETALRDGAARSKALPFRFLAAARHAPTYAQAISDAMLTAVQGWSLPGKTIIVVDVSPSMDWPLAGRSQMSRMDAAGALAVLLREVCRDVDIYTFSGGVTRIQAWRGLPLVEGIVNSQERNGTYLRRALEAIRAYERNAEADRVLVLTDEQSHDGIASAWAPRSYVFNLATYEPALKVDSGWRRVNGFSERLVDWMALEEYGHLLADLNGGEADTGGSSRL